MPTILFRIKIRDGRGDEALASLRGMCEAVEKEEPDTQTYLFHRLREDHSTAVLFESYDSDDALAQHMQTPHMAAFRATLNDLFDPTQIAAERLDRVAGFVRGTPGDGSVAVVFRAGMQAGKEDEAVAALTNMVAETQKNEPDTLAYVLTRSTDKPEVVIFEAYKSQEAFDAHQKTPHMDAMRNAFAGLFDVSAVKLEWLERVGGFARPTA